ncbi:MAG: type IV pilus modification PilV family protein [Limisphaerales bacterium]
MKVLSKHDIRAFTLIEVVVSTAIAAMVISGSIYGYTLSAQRAQWSSYSLAANSLAIQCMEQARAAKWDPMAFPPVDELVATNFPLRVEVLDIPTSGSNLAYATNVTSIATVSASPPLKQIRVECTWSFVNGKVFTNTMVTYRAADQ